MDSIELPTGRSELSELEFEIGLVARHPVAGGLMRAAAGLVAIVNENHEIVAVNDTFLKELGIEDGRGVLGLKPGEALDCRYAAGAPLGCGSSEHCQTCGAAIAMATARAIDEPNEQICALSAMRDGVRQDLAFLVRAQPLAISNRRFVLVYLQDITLQQQRAALTRSFYHDLNNILTSLGGACMLLEEEGHPTEGTALIRQTVDRLAREIEMQRFLFLDEHATIRAQRQTFSVETLIEELESLYSRHPAARNRVLEFPAVAPDAAPTTDFSLCLRILSNMITNALEASNDGDLVRLRAARRGDVLILSVWNAQTIPEAQRLRIFQRNFSTKDEPGRGFGTYSMKLFAEKYLGGRVEFDSGPEGTEFRLLLPLE